MNRTIHTCLMLLSSAMQPGCARRRRGDGDDARARAPEAALPWHAARPRSRPRDVAPHSGIGLPGTRVVTHMGQAGVPRVGSPAGISGGKDFLVTLCAVQHSARP